MGSRIRIKVCGITTEDDARDAATAGADAIGLNFFYESPRFVDLDRARQIAAETPPFVEFVGVFVKERLKVINDWIRATPRVSTIQWIGENRELPSASEHPVIAAFAVGDRSDLSALDAYLDQCRNANALPLAVLVDARVKGQYGGTGAVAPWELLADFHPPVPLILAGGLTPENVAEAIRRVRPWAVDVASGVERSSGRKDPDRMRRFIDAARNAAEQSSLL